MSPSFVCAERAPQVHIRRRIAPAGISSTLAAYLQTRHYCTNSCTEARLHHPRHHIGPRIIHHGATTGATVGEPASRATERNTAHGRAPRHYEPAAHRHWTDTEHAVTTARPAAQDEDAGRVPHSQPALPRGAGQDGGGDQHVSAHPQARLRTAPGHAKAEGGTGIGAAGSANCPSQAGGRRDYG